MAGYSSNQKEEKMFYIPCVTGDVKADTNDASVEELDCGQEADREDEDTSRDVMSDEDLSGVRSFFLPLREMSKKKQRRKRSDKEKACGKQVYKSEEDKRLVQYTDQMKRVSAWLDEYDTSSGSEAEQNHCMTCVKVPQPRIIHIGNKEQMILKDCSYHDLESRKELERAEGRSAKECARCDSAKKQKERHKSVYKHDADDRVDAVSVQEGRFADMFLCDARPNINSKRETETEAMDKLSNVLSSGIEKLTSKYEAEIRRLRRLAQVANGKYETSEKEKRDIEEKLRKAETDIHRLQKNRKENAKSNDRLRQEFEEHMRECNAKQEQVKKVEEADPTKTRKTNGNVTSTKLREEILAEGKGILNKMNYTNKTSRYESKAFCAFCITREDDAADNSRNNTMLYERLEKLESAVLKLGSIAQESVEREQKLEDEFSQVKRSVLGFASRFKNSLAHGTLRDIPVMLSEVQANDVATSCRTANATSNAASKYIATLCEIGKSLCSESKYIAATIHTRNHVVEELHEFDDYARETARTQINNKLENAKRPYL